MALRVLLADESTTIKRVIQLSLQDYAVNVQNVTGGLDVVPVAAKFKPDIIFVDVLLPKKNGYEVCAEIKSHPELNKTPVVLIWSGFVELDKDRFQASQANGHLEKPFEINTLRSIVKNLVPKTKTQDLSQYLVFPDQPKQEKPPTRPAPQPAVEVGSEVLSAGEMQSLDSKIENSTWSMDSFAPLEQFEEIKLPPTPPSLSKKEIEPESDIELLKDEDLAPGTEPTWSHKRLERYRLNIDEEDDEDLTVEFEEDKPTPVLAPLPAEPPALKSTPSRAARPTEVPLDAAGVTAAQVEKIIREQTRETLEQLVLKVLPEIAEQVIQRELERLIAERK